MLLTLHIPNKLVIDDCVEIIVELVCPLNGRKWMSLFALQRLLNLHVLDRVLWSLVRSIDSLMHYHSPFIHALPHSALKITPSAMH